MLFFFFFFRMEILRNTNADVSLKNDGLNSLKYNLLSFDNKKLYIRILANISRDGVSDEGSTNQNVVRIRMWKIGGRNIKSSCYCTTVPMFYCGQIFRESFCHMTDGDVSIMYSVLFGCYEIKLEDIFPVFGYCSLVATVVKYVIIVSYSDMHIKQVRSLKVISILKDMLHV